MKSTNFQLIFLGACILLTLLGVGAFAVSGGLRGSSGGVGTVTIWGTVPQIQMDHTLQTLREQDKTLQDVHYVEKKPATYTTDLVNAMAGGTGPDLFLIPQDTITSFKDKISLIPYSAVSQSTYTSSYIEEGQQFLSTQGILALPFSIDPLVMYWNRDHYATAGISKPPLYWRELLEASPKLTMLDSANNITQSATALGGWNNITNAKEILATLFLQAGDRIVTKDAAGNEQVVFDTALPNAPEKPAESALTFYTQFANPSKTSYSWNRSLKESKEAFIAGSLSTYFGFASEYAAITERNPNLRFGVAVLPQIEGGSTHITYGKLLGVAIARSSQNQAGALLVAQKLSSAIASAAFAGESSLPSVRTDVTLDTSANAVAAAFVQSALIARGWDDPAPAETNVIFGTMVESVLSSKALPPEAAAEAVSELQAIIQSHT